MKATENVWVYVDALASASDALEAGLELARRSGATLTLVGALGRSEDRVFGTSFGAEILRIVREDREARLRDLAGTARSSLPAGQISWTLLEGEVPWHRVVAHAVEHRPDVILVPSRAREGSGFDSVTQHFFRKCPAPVWAVVPGSPAVPRRVLAAVDPGFAGSDARLLARGVLHAASRIAAGEALELHVAHAWGLVGEAVIRARLGAASAAQFLARQRQLVEEQVQELLAQAEAGASTTATHLPRADPAEAIPALAERLDADLVVLGTAGRTGLPGFLIGSTAEGIIARLARSVLVVKPPGFVSPVSSR